MRARDRIEFPAELLESIGQLEPFIAAAWNEEDHPRAPRGDEDGGQFVSKAQRKAREELRRQRELREAKRGLKPAKTKHDIPMKKASSQRELPWRDALSRLHEITGEDVSRGQIPGLVESVLREGVAGHARDTDITLAPSTGPISSILVAHEAGHYVANEIQREHGSMSIPELEPFRKSEYEVLDPTPTAQGRVKVRRKSDGAEMFVYPPAASYENPFGLNPDPGEILADTYSELLHMELPEDPDRRALLERVAKTAERMGLPSRRLYRVKPDLSTELVGSAWDESEHPRHPGGTSEGGRFAPKGEDIFTSDLPETWDDFLEDLSKQDHAWEQWKIDSQSKYGGEVAQSWPGQDDLEAITAKVQVQREISDRLQRVDRLDGGLAGDPDFLSLMEVMDPHGDWASEFEPGGEMQLATTKAEQVAALAISTWARTSSDEDPIAVAFQIAAEKEFGLEPNAYVHEAWDNIIAYSAGGAALTDQQMRGARKFLRAQYDATQEMFAKAGITHVYAFRGMRWSDSDTPEEIKALLDSGRVAHRWALADYEKNPSGRPPQQSDYPGIGVLPIHGNAMSSWSNSYEHAESFSSLGTVHAVLGARIDVRRILSTPFSGFGCLNEQEFVVLGDKDMDAFTWAWRDGDWHPGSQLEDYWEQWLKEVRQ